MRAKKNILNTALLPVNILLLIFLVFFFCITLAKIYLNEGFPNKAAKLFKLVKNSSGLSFCYLEDNNIEAFENLWKDSTPPPLIEGIKSWTNGSYNEASLKFEEAGNTVFYFDSEFISGNTEKLNKISDLTPLQQARLNNETKIEPENIKTFIENSCWHPISRTFIRLDNIQSAAYYLLKKPTNKIRLIANLLIGNEIDESKLNFQQKDIFELLRGNFTELDNNYPFLDSSLEETLLKYDDIDALINSFSYSNDKAIDNQALINDLKENVPGIQVYNILPSQLEEHDVSPLLTTLIATSLSLIIILLLISVFILYKKYKANQIIQRQKELEKMDALSIAKNQSMEARRKRDKTELNVSSFVTMNIQLEVLDLAFTKLGVRANPQKLAEQIEKTKIPNISFKIYTISNSYGLKVKMLNMTVEDLMKNDSSSGIMILVLKGDLVALLKRADNQNVYLQFSKKDSRKVPFPALKLSWEGNVILLNM